MIKRFLLVDECDNFYTDLIEFEETVDIMKVKELIRKCKNELEGEYTNEDIYNYLKKLGVKFRIIFLGDYEKVYY